MKCSPWHLFPQQYFSFLFVSCIYIATTHISDFISLFRSLSSCPVETQSGLSSPSYSAHSSTVSSRFPFLCSYTDNSCNCLTTFTCECDNMLQYLQCIMVLWLQSEKGAEIFHFLGDNHNNQTLKKQVLIIKYLPLPSHLSGCCFRYYKIIRSGYCVGKHEALFTSGLLNLFNLVSFILH